MEDTARDGETLSREQFHRAALEIDEKPSVDDVEELVLLLVLVPVILALEHPEPHNRVVDLRQRLVVPAISARVSQGLQVDELQGLVQNVEMSSVRIGHLLTHTAAPPRTCGNASSPRARQSKIPRSLRYLPAPPDPILRRHRTVWSISMAPLEVPHKPAIAPPVAD